MEEKPGGAVEIVATRADGLRLALEHTLIQPFVGEKFDSEIFMRAFGRIEENHALIVPERNLDVILPVNAIPKGYNWGDVGKDLLTWLLANHTDAPQEGQSSYVVRVAATSKNRPLALTITVRTMHLPGIGGSCLIASDKMPGDLEVVVEKALRTKIPKLAATAAEKRILLLERDQIGLGDSEIYRQIVNPAPAFPDLAKINEIWIANTSILAPEQIGVFYAHGWTRTRGASDIRERCFEIPPRRSSAPGARSPRVLAECLKGVQPCPSETRSRQRRRPDRRGAPDCG